LDIFDDEPWKLTMAMIMKGKNYVIDLFNMSDKYINFCYRTVEDKWKSLKPLVARNLMVRFK
jgi:hypothetical protein